MSLKVFSCLCIIILIIGIALSFYRHMKQENKIINQWKECHRNCLRHNSLYTNDWAACEMKCDGR